VRAGGADSGASERRAFP